MDKSDYAKFFNEDTDFLNDEYPTLSDDDKYMLWVYVLAHDMRDRNPNNDPLKRFNKENYEKWKSLEPNFDKILEKVIEEYIQIWNPWYKRWREHTLEEEIHKRLNNE